RRAKDQVKALTRLGFDRPYLLSYEDLLTGQSLSDAIPEGAIFRVESWGDEPVVEQLLIASGDGPDLDSSVDFGRYDDQVALKKGVEAMLLGVQAVLAERPDVQVMNAPDAVLDMLDKRRARERLVAAGVPVAPGLDDLEIREPTDLRRAMARAGWGQVFVKPRWGSSAAGIIALRSSGGRIASYSTLELVGADDSDGATEDKLYHSVRVRREDRVDRIDRLLRPILQAGAVVERWIPKRAHPQSRKAMDFRVVCIGGEPQHSVIRTSPSPITNLHLGNARESFDEFANQCPKAAAAVYDVARLAAAAFPSSMTVSADVLLERERDRALVLEVNSFGELLHRVTINGADAYEALWSHAFLTINNA
ncbi:MAG: STM4014 family protein, partial [Planctomycetota bacterium]